MPSSANAEANLEELLSLSRHGAQRESRSTKIRSLTDEDIAQVISIGTKREFTREGLERILLVVLDTAAQEGGIASGTPIDRAGDVKVQLEECTDDFDSIALSVEELPSSAGSSPTASAASEHCIKRDPGIWEAFDTTVKRARKNKDVSANSDTLQKAESAWSVSLTAPGHILFGPTVPEHLLYVDPTPWHPEFRESWAGMSKDPDHPAFFTKDELGFYIPKEMLSTQETNDGLEPLPKMPLELSVQIRRKIGADFIQGWKSIERYGDMILCFICSASHKQSTVASTTPAMSTIDSYLKALLALSGGEQLVSPRRALLQSLNDEDLAGLVTKAIGREFARGDLEDIVKDPALVYSYDAGED
ncbi:unnamed protein product [Alternaria alternata]